MDTIDDRLRHRQLFDHDVNGYQSGRPGYPKELYEILEEVGALRAGASVLEIGPGGGQATRELLDHGAEVVAVELGANFAARLRSDFADRSLTLIEGDFDSVTELMPGFDLVACPASLHWLNPATALTKISGLLRPGGWLAAWWTLFGDPSRPTPFRAVLDSILRRHHAAGMLREPGPLDHETWTARIAESGAFRSVRMELIQWSTAMSASSLTRLYGTFAAISDLNPADREALLHDITIAVDDAGGEVTENYITIAYLADRNI